MGSPTNPVREWTVPHLQLSLTTLQDQTGCEASEINHAAMPEVSPHSAAYDQALPAPRSLMRVRNQAVVLNSPTRRRMTPMKMRTLRLARVKLRFRVMARWHPMAKKGKGALLSKTPSLGSAKSLVCMRTLTQSLTLGRRSSLAHRSGTNPAPRRTCLPRTQMDYLLRKRTN